MLRNLILDCSSILGDDIVPVAGATNLKCRFGQAELLLEELRESVHWSFDSFHHELAEVYRGRLERLLCENSDRPYRVSLLPHALGFLRFCQATRRRVFLLGRADDANYAEQLGELGVAHFFEQIHEAAAERAAEIGEILKTNDLAATETALIGDSLRDIEIARDLGMTSIAILTGSHSRGNLVRANPDMTARHLGELEKLLEDVPPGDEIRIEELELMARVGVPDLERAEPQRLTVSITLQPGRAFGELGDDLAQAVDYAAVCEDLRNFVAWRADKLIETLAHAMAEHLLRCFGLARVELELRKFVLPETRHVAVRVVRQTGAMR